MHVRNPKAINISNQIIRYVLVAISNGMIQTSFSEINALKSEIKKWSKIWIKTNKIIYTSGSKVSGIQSERLAISAFYKLKDQIHQFGKYNHDHGNGKALRGYEITINPSKLNYDNVSSVNRKIIRKLKTTIPNGLIYKAVEHTYCNRSSQSHDHLYINLHFHYLIVSTSPINQRNTYRSIKKIASKATHGAVNKGDGRPYRKVTNWTKAIDYVVKQQGKFPLMMIHHQWQRFLRLSVMDRIKLLAKDYNNGKGVECHRLYYVGAVAKEWHKINVDRAYCHKNGVLVPIRPNSRQKAKNKKIRPNHHTSNNEAMSRFYLGTYYGWTHEKIHTKPISLF